MYTRLFRYMFFLLIFIIILCGIVKFISVYSISTQKDVGFIDVYFCPSDDCDEVWLSYLHDSSAYCALYDLNDERMIAALQNDHVALHYESYAKLCPGGCGAFWYPVHNSGLMHNKFCVIDGEIIITGSTNPTYNGFHRNRNNLLVIQSPKLAKNYLMEFNELVTLKRNIPNLRSTLMLVDNKSNDEILIGQYFCPEDHCEKHVLEVLEHAHTSIDFMTFSFTSDAIGSTIVEKSSAVAVQGLFDSSQVSQYSEYSLMKDAGLNVKKYSGNGKLHHKVFIVDNEYIVTGSYNPTANGNERNDENLLIMRNPRLAQAYLSEFADVWN